MLHAVEQTSASDSLPALVVHRADPGARARRLHLLRDLAHDVVLQVHGHEHDLAARALRHRLQRLELPDLHRSGAREDVRGLAHEARGVDLGARGDDLALADALLLRGGGERGGDLGREDDVLDEDALDRDAPLVRDVADDLRDLERDRLALGHDALHRARADDVPERRLRALDEGLAEVGDAERGAVRVRDLEVDDRVAAGDPSAKGHERRSEDAHLDVDVVTRDDLLPPNGADLDLNVDDTQRLRANVDLNKTRVDCLVELPKP